MLYIRGNAEWYFVSFFLIQENPGLQYLAEEITKKFGKKSDRVIGNRDLIANPFSQGYSRSDFDRILDHFLAK